MSSPQLKWLVLFVAFFCVLNKGVAQALEADSSSSPAVKNAVGFYNAAFSEQLHLYNGPEYPGYPRPFVEGDPYFLTTDWSNGTVSYDGNTYSNVSVLYDLVADEVIILGANKISKIRLIKDRVSRFSMASHFFINMQRDSLVSTNMAPGFYDVRAEGKISLLVRRTKNIQSNARQVIELKVLSKDHYFLKKNNRYFPIHSKKALLEQLGDQKKEVQKYMRANKLRYRRNTENTIIKSVEYYNQLTKQ